MKKILILSFLVTVAAPCSAQWYFVSGGLGTTGGLTAFGVHDTNLFAGSTSVTRYVSPQVGVEADKGIDFTQGSVTSFASLGQYFFAGVGNGLVYRSTNNGSNWVVNDSIGSPIAASAQYLFAVDAKGIARSPDGERWESTKNGLSPNNFAASGAYVFATTSTGVWHSHDSGWTWVRDTTPLLSINSFAFIGTLTFGANGPIIKSTDFGSHWTEITIPGRNVSLLVSDSTFLFAGTDSGVYVSLDSGGSWREVSEGLPGKGYIHITALAVFDTLLVAGVDAGGGFGYASARPIREMVDTTKSAVQAVQPVDSLSIYPNPSTGTVTVFSGGTTILGVSVLNILGEEVLDIPNARQSEISFDMSKLPSGTYFLEIQTAKGIVLRKVIRE